MGLCHYGSSDWNFLLRFECNLHRDSDKQLQWKYFRHYSTVRDVMVDPERFGVPPGALQRKNRSLPNRPEDTSRITCYDLPES